MNPKTPDVQRQQLDCTNCNVRVLFDIDFALDGNHEISCPKCGHIHYRVVMDGKITDIRWRSSMQVIHVANISLVTVSSASTSYFLSDAWASTTNTT